MALELEWRIDMSRNIFNNRGQRAGNKTLDTLIEENAPVNIVPTNSGIFQTETEIPNICFTPSIGSLKIENRNAFIVFGKDMPSTLASGYGGKGASNCDTIDIVVGRISSTAISRRESRLLPGASENCTVVSNNFGADAARIYISQLTNVDTNFGISEGKTGLLKARSAVAIKADGVRLVGREGIKIVTGKALLEQTGPDGELNSQGGNIKKPAPKIELIAGNNIEPREVRGGLYRKKESIETLQPIVKGHNLRDCLLEITAQIHKLNSALSNFAMTQVTFNSAVSVNLFPANASHFAAAGTASSIKLINQVISNLGVQRSNLALLENDFFENYGYKYICSTNVTTT